MFSRRRLLQSLAAPALLGAAPKDPVVGLAFGDYGMKAMSTEQALRTIAAIGYDGAELCLIPGWPTDPAKLSAAERRALRSLLAETGLAAPALLDMLTIKAAPEKRARNLERLKQDVDLANELAPGNPPLIYTSLGGRSDEWENLKRPMADELHAWARIAEAAQVTVCFKPHADHAVDNAERAFWLLQQVGSRRIRLVYDYGHFFLQGYSLAASLKEMLPYSASISVKDSARNGDKSVYLLPGDGKVDYLEYFRLLKELRYSGFVGVEVSAMIHQKPGYEAAPTARLCYERLAPLFARAGLRRPARKT